MLSQEVCHTSSVGGVLYHVTENLYSQTWTGGPKQNRNWYLNDFQLGLNFNYVLFTRPVTDLAAFRNFFLQISVLNGYFCFCFVHVLDFHFDVV